MMLCLMYMHGSTMSKGKRNHPFRATSCYVGDNTDIIIMTEALKLVRVKIIKCDQRIIQIRNEIQKIFNTWIYTFSASTAYNSRWVRESKPLADGSRMI